MTCKDCLFHDFCEDYNGYPEYLEEYIKTGKEFKCSHFKEKSRFIELPFPIGTTLYRITNPYRQEPKVTEFVVTNFVMQGKKHELMVEVRVNGVPGRNIMKIKSFYRSREEAEKVLKKENRND